MKSRWIGICALVALSATGASAQEKPAQPPEKPPAAAAQPRESAGPVPLRVTVVLSRYQGDKRISSLPYILGVTANGRGTTLRMGVDVPVSTTVFGSDGKAVPTPSYNYRNVGTNIDCSAIVLAGGIFQLAVTVNDSSIHLDAAKKPGGIAMDVPAFRTFNSSFTILLRDGQAAQYTSATDPVSGEVMKIDLTLNVMK